MTVCSTCKYLVVILLDNTLSMTAPSYNTPLPTIHTHLSILLWADSYWCFLGRSVPGWFWHGSKTLPGTSPIQNKCGQLRLLGESLRWGRHGLYYWCKWTGDQRLPFRNTVIHPKHLRSHVDLHMTRPPPFRPRQTLPTYEGPAQKPMPRCFPWLPQLEGSSPSFKWWISFP